MRIGFTGSHGTGKTSTSIELTRRAQFKNYVTIPSTAREAAEAGYGINRDADELSQYMVLMARIVGEELDAEGLMYISDRTPVDSLAYTDYQMDKVWMNRNPYYWKQCYRITRWHMRKYDHVFYFPITFPIEKDGVRDGSVNYQKDIDRRVRKLLKEMEISYTTMPAGTIKQRAKFISDTIKKEK